MECGVCTNTFDSGAAKPRNLSCGHAFCTECLSTIQKNELQKTNLRQIRCPECRTLTPCADVTKLPVNFTLLRLVEEVSEAKLKSTSSPPSSAKPPPTGVKLPAPVPTPTFATPVKPVSSPATKPTPPSQGFTEVIKPSLPSQTRPTTTSPPPSSSSSGPKKRTTHLHKHELVAKAHSIGWYCDICLQKYEKDNLSWDCDPCGYDICNTCIGPEQKEASAPEPSPSYDSGPISGVGGLCQECHKQPREIRCVACSVEVCTSCDTRVHSVSAKSRHTRQSLVKETKSREPTFTSASEARSYYELMKASELKSTLEKAGIPTIGMNEKSELVELALEHFYRPQETKSTYESTPVTAPSSTSSTSSSTTSSSTTSSSSQSYSFSESALPQAVDPMKYEAKLQAKLVEVQKMMITNLKKIMEDFGIPHEGMELGELRLSVAQLLLLNDSGDSGGTSDAERERKEKEKRERERQDREEEEQKKRDRERLEKERKALSSYTPSVGTTVDAKDDQDVWLEAKILEVHNDYSGKMYSVEFKGFNEMYRGWARDGSVAPFKQFSTWANSEKKAARLFPVGKEVMAKDKKGKFHVATIKTISGMRFYVHFKGYTDAHDEWIDSSNLQDHWKKSSAFVSQLQFLTACQDGKMDVVKSYLEAGGTVEAKTTTAGDTALILAARGNHAAISRLLIDDYKADVNSVNDKRSTPLIAAAMRGHSALVRTLIENKASVNATTSENDTAMSLAVWQNHTDTAMVLQRNGASCHRIDRFGDTMLLDAAKNGNDEILKMLLDKGLDVNHSNKEGETAGTRAARNGHASCLTTLLENGAKIDHQDNTGQTMLHYALLAQHTACVDILVDKSADVDVKDYKGVTPRAIGKVKGARPGMRVRVKSGHTPKYGWGNVKPGEVGTVMVQLGTRVFVDFPSQSTAWRGIASELEDVGSLPTSSAGSGGGDDLAMTLLLAALMAGGGSRCHGCRTSFSSQKDKNECCICKNDFCVSCIQLAKRTRLIGFLVASETVLCCQPCIDKAS